MMHIPEEHLLKSGELFPLELIESVSKRGSFRPNFRHRYGPVVDYSLPQI